MGGLELCALELSKHFVCSYFSGIWDLGNYLSDWVEIFRDYRGVYRIAVFKFQNIPITLRKNAKIGEEFWENSTIDVSSGPVRMKVNQNFPENLVLKP